MFIACVFMLVGVIILLTMHERSSYVYRAVEFLNQFFEYLYVWDPAHPHRQRVGFPTSEGMKKEQEPERNKEEETGTPMHPTFMPDESVVAVYLPIVGILCLGMAVHISYNSGFSSHKQEMARNVELLADLQTRLSERHLIQRIVLETLNEKGEAISQEIYKPAEETEVQHEGTRK